ncbi:hypothetical protein V1527DRAFT_43030 [Lipomyces starkeyi]
MSDANSIPSLLSSPVVTRYGGEGLPEDHLRQLATQSDTQSSAWQKEEGNDSRRLSCAERAWLRTILLLLLLSCLLLSHGYLSLFVSSNQGTVNPSPPYQTIGPTENLMSQNSLYVQRAVPIHLRSNSFFCSVRYCLILLAFGAGSFLSILGLFADPSVSLLPTNQYEVIVYLIPGRPP